MIRVLHIDDQEAIRLLSRVNLEAEGMTVLDAKDGPSGLAKATSTAPIAVGNARKKASPCVSTSAPP